MGIVTTRPESPSTPTRGWASRLLGVAGEFLITLGVLVGLFVVWEVWWTDVVGTRHQRDLVEGLDWTIPAIPGGVVEGVDSSDPDHPLGQADPIVPEDRRERGTAPPDEAEPEEGETFATMYVPRWGEDYVRPISEGVGRREVLDRLGIGHYPDTALPGGWGNFAVAGHRSTYGKPFDRIEELVEGDTIVVRTESTWYVYRVTETRVVRPSYSAAIAPRPGDEAASPDGRYITLTTCHPRLSARERYIVHGVLEYWAHAWAGYPPEVIPGEGDPGPEEKGTEAEV